MRAGRLRHRITLEKNDTTRDEWGGTVAGWVNAFPQYADGIPADVVPLSGREFMAAGERQGEVQARIEMRYLAGVTDAMRVVFDGQVYAIRAVLPDRTARRHLNLMVAGGVSSGE